jgi:hypothetical protein
MRNIPLYSCLPLNAEGKHNIVHCNHTLRSSHYHKADLFCHMLNREGQLEHNQVSAVR